jgi:hypothetical protein
MKVCEACGEEISTKDPKRAKRARASRAMHDAAMLELGLVKVRGALGGTYWE